MNNLYKSFKLSVLLTAVIGLAACQKGDGDVMAINDQIANNTIAGIYTYLNVDSTAMQTTLYEWVLSKDAQNGRTGFYRVAATGNGADVNTEETLTWEKATMASDGLSMTIPVTVGANDPQQLSLLWHDGVVTVNDYTTTKELISKVSVLRSVHENFANLDFVYDDTTSYVTIAKDTTYYLAWKTQVVSYTQEEIDAYKQYLIDMADTLAWFNETYPNRAVPDTVRFSTKQQSDGTYKGQISVSYEDMDIADIATNHGPLHIINSEMIFNRAENGTTSGSFVFHEKIWNEEYYNKPGSDKAVHTESVLEITDAKWTPSAYTNVKKFNILLNGKYHESVTHEENGVMVSDVATDSEAKCYEISLSAFNKADGEVTYKELKYKTK